VEDIKENSMEETKEEISPLGIERSFLLKDSSNRPKGVIFSIFFLISDKKVRIVIYFSSLFY
jgi:hypothetical protein